NDCWLKGAVAVSQQDAQLSETVDPPREIADHEVGLAVLVQIRYQDSIRKLPARIVGDRRLERSITVAQQHRNRAVAYGIGTIDGAGAIVHYQNVGLAIPVHIGH